MSSNNYNPDTIYPEDETFKLTGKVVNSISKRIIELRAEVKELKDATLQDELADLRLRDKNPAIKDAWDQYQTVLGLARTN